MLGAEDLICTMLNQNLRSADVRKVLGEILCCEGAAEIIR